MKLVYQYFGNGIALGIYGNREEITTFGNYLFNHGATKGDTHFLSESFGYVLTDKQTLRRGLANGEVTKDRFLANEYGPRGVDLHQAPEPSLWPSCLEIADWKMSQITREDFLEEMTPGSVYDNPGIKHEG